jgi:hypothetical protein
MSIQNYGVAPDWVATGDGDYSLPEGKTCIGFYVETGGVVSFDSLGTTLEVTYVDAVFVPAHATAFNALNTTASGIYALLIG